RFERLLPVRRLDDAVARLLEREPHHLADMPVIVDDQDARHRTLLLTRRSVPYRVRCHDAAPARASSSRIAPSPSTRATINAVRSREPALSAPDSRTSSACTRS